MSKKILSVGFEIPGGSGEYVPYKSDRSLMDADIGGAVIMFAAVEAAPISAVETEPEPKIA